MNISTEIESVVTALGEEKGMEALAKAGFDGWDFTLFSHDLVGADYLAYAQRMKQLGESLGMVCNQSHAPFPTTDPSIRDLMKRAIETTAEAGGSICVIHPLHTDTAEANAAFYRELLPFAKEHGVKIATENIFSKNHSPAACTTPSQYISQLERISDPSFVACLDIGHAEIAGSAVDMIHTLGHHLQALHVHDNDKKRDLHQLPFAGSIDFAPIMQALKETGYTGWLTLEADGFLSNLPQDQVAVHVPQLAAAARRLLQI